MPISRGFFIILSFQVWPSPQWSTSKKETINPS